MSTSETTTTGSSLDDPAFPRSDEEFDPVEAYQMPLMEHLRELRRRLIISMVTLAIGCCVAFVFVDDIWGFLVKPMNEALATSGRGSMGVTGVLEAFLTQLKVSALAGALGASPILSWQIWRFVAPGLYPNEKRLVVPLVFSSTSLFLGGAAFAYAVIFRFAFPFFIEIAPEDVEHLIKIENYLGLATRLLLAFGVCFQLPVVAFFLARAGLIDARDMFQFIRYAIVGIFVLSAMLTPPDVVSQLLMAAPMTVLYFVGIVVAWLFSTKERPAEG